MWPVRSSRSTSAGSRSTSFDPAALATVRQRAPMPICSGENLYGSREFRPYLEAGRSRRCLRRRHLERVPPGEEDRRSRRDVRGQLRAAQLLLAPGDVHRRSVVRGDPERADSRVRRRRRALARRARHGPSRDRRWGDPRAVRAGLGCRGRRGRPPRASVEGALGRCGIASDALGILSGWLRRGDPDSSATNRCQRRAARPPSR